MKNSKVNHYPEEQMSHAYGFHLMLDCYRCDHEKLNDIDACYHFLDMLVDNIGMQKQTQPYVFRTPESFEGQRGLSGWVPIVESGISIHTLTETDFVSLDVYSCKRFDIQEIISFTQRFFNPAEIETNFVLRGRKYSQEI